MYDWNRTALVENKVGPTMVGVAEPTVLELRVDNAVIRVCLKVQWVGRPGAGTPMALILTTSGGLQILHQGDT